MNSEMQTSTPARGLVTFLHSALLRSARRLSTANTADQASSACTRKPESRLQQGSVHLMNCPAIAMPQASKAALLHWPAFGNRRPVTVLCALMVSLVTACGGGGDAGVDQAIADRNSAGSAASTPLAVETSYVVQSALSYKPQQVGSETPAFEHQPPAASDSATPGSPAAPIAASQALDAASALESSSASLSAANAVALASTEAVGETSSPSVGATTSTASAADAANSPVMVAAAGDTQRGAIPASAAWLPRADPRVVTLLDGEELPENHHERDLLQLADGQSIHSLKAIPANGIRHADGSLWFGREKQADGRSTFTARMWRYQPLFQGISQRAEWHAPNIGIQNLPWVIDETRGYWFALDYRFGSDVVENTGTQYGGGAAMTISGLHSITWGDLPRSEGQDFGGRVVGRQLMWRIHGPGANPSFVYDVRTTPLSTQVVRTVAAGGESGTSRHWIIADLQPNVSVKLVGRVKFADTLAGKPRTEIWRKIGDGPMEKIIDNKEANTFSKGVRYWKVGNYTWDTSAQWWGNRDSRTMHIRSDVWVRDEKNSSNPQFSPEMLMKWLDR